MIENSCEKCEDISNHIDDSEVEEETHNHLLELHAEIAELKKQLYTAEQFVIMKNAEIAKRDETIKEIWKSLNSRQKGLMKKKILQKK